MNAEREMATADGLGGDGEVIERPCRYCGEPIYMHPDSDAAHAGQVQCSEGQGCDRERCPRCGGRDTSTHGYTVEGALRGRCEPCGLPFLSFPDDEEVV